MDLTSAAAYLERLRQLFGVKTLAFGNWGEPLLHPQLPALVRLAASNGFKHITILSNLSVARNMEELADSGLTGIRVSLSGLTPEVYNRSHRHGQLDLVLKNLDTLLRCREQLERPFHIVIGWHRYRHNEYRLREAADFCAARGFEFFPYFGHIGGIDALHDWSSGTLEEPLRSFVSETVFTEFIEQACRLNAGATSCPQANLLVVQADGRLLHCCAVFRSPCSDRDILSMNIEESTEFKQLNGPYCVQCLDRGWSGYMHRLKTLEEYEGRIPRFAPNDLPELISGAAS